MKQITVRLGDMAERSLEQVKNDYGYKSNQAALAAAILQFDYHVEKVSDQQKRIVELEAVVAYLEAQLKADRG